MRWEADEDNPEVHLLLGEDQDREPIELGRIERWSPDFWHWSSSYVQAFGGCQNLEDARKRLAQELEGARDMLSFNLGRGVEG